MTCNLCAHEESGPWCVAACRDEGALKLVDYQEFARTHALKQALKLTMGSQR
jgi:Fe-S-cluster-containing hydrogenase component 2